MEQVSEMLVKEIWDNKKRKITSIEVSDEDFNGDNFLGSVCRLKINYKKNYENKVLHLFCKSSPYNKIMRCFLDTNDHYVVETYCYEHIIPAFTNLQKFYNIPKEERFNYPKFYNSSVEYKNEAILLEDVSVRNYKMCDRRKPLDLAHVTMVIKNLARLHACSFILKETNKKLYEEFTSKIANQYNYGKRFIEVQKESIRIVSKSLSPKKNLEIVKNLDEKYNKYFNAKAAHPYNVICHGDPWINNLLFKYEGQEVSKMIFIDWQLCRLASPVTDIAYFICVSTDKKFRDEHFDNIFDIYYQALKEAVTKMGQDINKCYPKKIFHQHIKDFFQLGLALGMIALPVFLGEPGEIKSLEEIFNDFETGTYTMKINDTAFKRINDLVGDFITRKLI